MGAIGARVLWGQGSLEPTRPVVVHPEPGARPHSCTRTPAPRAPLHLEHRLPICLRRTALTSASCALHSASRGDGRSVASRAQAPSCVKWRTTLSQPRQTLEHIAAGGVTCCGRQHRADIGGTVLRGDAPGQTSFCADAHLGNFFTRYHGYEGAALVYEGFDRTGHTAKPERARTVVKANDTGRHEISE